MIRTLSLNDFENVCACVCASVLLWNWNLMEMTGYGCGRSVRRKEFAV